MNKICVILAAPLVLNACSIPNSQQFGPTQAEQLAGYRYIPLEPSSTHMLCTSKDGLIKKCEKLSKEELLNSLPDNSVRIASRLVTGSAKSELSAFGANIGVEGNTYDVIIDFVNTQTVNKQFIGKWFVSVAEQTMVIDGRCYPLEKSVLSSAVPDKYENWSLTASLSEGNADYRMDVAGFDNLERNKPDRKEITLHCGSKKDGTGNKVPYDQIKISPEPFNIPVYIGIGLRLKASVTVLHGEVNLSSLPALTAAVSAGNATGTMSVQTIGISGKFARSNLLLLDKIDATTIQNAIQVLSSIKASIETDDSVLTPRIVGFHNTIRAGEQGINLLHSLLSSDKEMNLMIDSTTYVAGGM